MSLLIYLFFIPKKSIRESLLGLSLSDSDKEAALYLAADNTVFKKMSLLIESYLWLVMSLLINL